MSRTVVDHPIYMPRSYEDVRPIDTETFNRHLGGFVPPRVYDIHAHLYTIRGLNPPIDLAEDEWELTQGLETYRRTMRSWMGDRAALDGLFFALPTFPEMDVASENRHVRDEVAGDGASRALMLIRPADDPAEVEREVEAGGYAGFKVYHVFADVPDTLAATIDRFLPEWAWRIADERGLVIMLHMMRDAALADPDNQRYLRDRCRRHGGARLILAHAGRSFCAQHTIDGIEALRGLSNVYFDNSAVCEPGALQAILRVFGPSRLLFGSDWPICNGRGRCVSLGSGFFWMHGHNTDYEDSTFGAPVLIGIESLLALRQAAVLSDLDDGDVERIFDDNARELLGLGPAPDGGVTQRLYREAVGLIPGGTQLLSKRPEVFAPGRWPAYFREASGCEVTDLDGRRFTDMSIFGIGACLLGYADPDVTRAVVRRVRLGSMSTLNSPEEVELARMLIEIHPWAEMVRYARTGGEAMAMAARIARARTGRDTVAVCGYHGWHDWYIAANLADDGGAGGRDALDGHLLPGLDPAGVPRALAGTAPTFRYNDLDRLTEIFAQRGGAIAAVVMEPLRGVDPEPGFLEGARELCDRHGAVLVFDEITVGWRLVYGGAHLRFGVRPDIAVFAKALGNGHPVAAVIGTRDAMDAAQGSFISSTYWTESVGPVAAIATLEKMRSVDVPAHVARIGRSMRQGWQRLSAAHGLPVQLTGQDALLRIGFDHADAAALATLFTIRMMDRGFLAWSAFYPSLAHEDHHVESYLDAADAVFPELVEASAKGDAPDRVGGAVRHGGFARLT